MNAMYIVHVSAWSASAYVSAMIQASHNEPPPAIGTKISVKQEVIRSPGPGWSKHV